jgi:hypothetical protein
MSFLPCSECAQDTQFYDMPYANTSAKAIGLQAGWRLSAP